MSMSWKCCSACRCPCKNNDLCPDTASTLISQGFQRSQSHESSVQSESKTTPSLEELRSLERRVRERLRNLPIPKLKEGVNVTDQSANTTNTDIPNWSDLESNEILILRKRLQEAELRNAIIEEKVNQISEKLPKMSSTPNEEKIRQLKRQIIDFIEDQFSRLLQNQH